MTGRRGSASATSEATAWALHCFECTELLVYFASKLLPFAWDVLRADCLQYFRHGFACGLATAWRSALLLSRALVRACIVCDLMSE